MTCYPSAEEMIERGENSVLHIHRSFRSSLGLMLMTALSVAGVLYCILHYGSAFRWAAILPVIFVLEIARRYINDLYIISRDQVAHQQGRISLRYAVPSIRCIDLRAINIEQTLWGRILNFGGVNLCTAAQSGAEVTMDGVAAPQELAKLIDDLRAHSQRAALEESGDQGTGRVGND